MSAAEPADPTQIPLNTGRGGSVIDITKRLHSGGTRMTAEGGWSAMAPPAGPDDRPEIDPALRLWAEDIEKSFRAIKLTLTDDDTAAAYVRTLEVLERTLEGSHATGLIDRGQLSELLGVLRGMKEVPRLV